MARTKTSAPKDSTAPLGCEAMATCERRSTRVELKIPRSFGIPSADIGKEHADTFRSVQHPDLRADYVLAHPPFNDSDWFRKDDDPASRDWHGAAAEKEQPQVDPQGAARQGHQFGVPPKGNANFAWVQHFIHHLAPQGMAGFVLANGSMSSNQSGEGDIRRALIEADLVDCMVALPGRHATQSIRKSSHGRN